MSLQVCHCGWSKVTTYHGLRTHQGRMGCTQRGVRGAESEQQNMWGNLGLPNNQQDLWLDIYTSLKIDTTVDCSSETSLQVCHCGWTQVTTYQGLRIHQGKMGCTQRGVRGAESDQQNMWGTAGLPKKQQDLWGDSYTSVKTDTNAGCSSETSLQVCHCGWKKMTTYKGLRIHQGKMGCTPKGVRIPETEQHYWKNQWEDVNQKKHQPAKKVIIKKEDVPSPPRINVRTKSASLTAAPIKEEYEASAIPHRSASLSSPQSAVVRPKKKERKDKTSLQVADRGAMTGYAAKAVTIKEEPHTPAIPHRSATLYEFPISVQMNESIGEHPTIYSVPAAARPQEKNIQATIKQEPYTPFAIPQQPLQTATNSKSGHELCDSSSAVQVNKSARERPTPSPRSTVVPPKKKEGKDQTSPQVNRSFRERPTIPPRPLVVPPKKEGKHQTSPQMCAAKAMQEKLKSELELKIHMREEKLQKKAAERVCESVPDSTIRTTRTHPAAADAVTKEHPKSSSETAQDSDFSTGMKVKQLALMFSATTKKTAAVQRHKLPQEEQKLPQAKPLAQTFLAATAQEKAVQRPQEKHEEGQKLPQVVDVLIENAALKAKPLVQKFLAATAQETAVQQPKEKHEEGQKLPQVVDVLIENAALKVKPLVQKFLAATAQETAVQQPKEKHEEEQNLPQVTPLARKFLAATAQETAVQPKEQDREDQKPALMPDSTSATTKMNPAAAETTRKEEPKSQSETAQFCDFSTGLKVKQLAWMFSDTTHKKAVRPKEKHNEERKPAQAKQERSKSELEQIIQMRQEKMSDIRAVERACESVPDSTSATTQTNSAAADAVTKEDPILLSETVQDSDFSTSMKVKQLALMFSATTKKTAAVQRLKEKHQEEQKLPQAKPLAQKFLAATAQETAVQRPEKHVEERKLPQVTPLAQKFLAATAQETAVQPKEQDREDQKPAPMPDSTSATTKMNPAAAETTQKEDPILLSETAQDSDFSTGMKVKQLALMFSATTKKTAEVQQPKEKHQEHQEEQKLPQVKPLVQKFLAATAQETAVQQPKEKHKEEQKLPQIPDSTSATTKMNPAATEATTKEDPKALTETVQLSDCSTGLKVKQLAWMFSATNQETAVQLREKHQEEHKQAQVKPLDQKLSVATAQETAKGKEMDDQKLSQVRQDRIPVDVNQKVEMREQNVAEDISSLKACKPLQDSLDCRPMETNGELSKVTEDAWQKSLDLKISNGTLRNTKSTKMGQVHQKLEKPSSNDLQRITKFAVDVKLDPTTAHRCLISSDGKKVRDERETNVADAPERFDLFGSVLGLNRFTSWKSYWEVEVSNKTGWDLGVAKGDANRKGKLLLSPDDGYWAIVHFKNKEYAALTSPPVQLLLKENLQKVGVFVDYEEGLVSFYNVTAKSHIYSFTPFSFTGEIVPYFSLHLGESADPLIISTVKHQ